ncbi:proteasome ATPase [Kocuria varians]|uniref:AAA ATPase forming ring-shaped complexes n=1 Tax=Kocuria varians TaxID=1272 RepID=A0A7D7L0N8_KOCVA|nr:proteasome ATPase [Kocuria varians]QMS57015.1 Proteasome-associated ATPase [Kocuria varians]
MTETPHPQQRPQRSPEEIVQRQMAMLRDQKRNLDKQLSALGSQNEKLVRLLNASRQEIVTLKKTLAAEAEPPATFATILQVNHGRQPVGEATGDGPVVTGPTVDVLAAGRRMRVALSPLVSLGACEPGLGVLLNENYVVVALLDYERTGEVATVKEVVDHDRVLTVGRSDEERVLLLSGRLRRERPKPGDAVTVDHRTGFALEPVARTDVEQLVLEEVPDVSYSDVGGLGPQIEAIRDAVELPHIHPEIFREHGLHPPKGILLYGPPGNGKTLIAKAVARSLAERSAAKAGRSRAEGYFLNIKGPELLDKYVGETERQIRSIFANAREQAARGVPVVVFFDEMDSLFRVRGSGLSSDVETTIVPQLLTEIDGVEKLDNVMVVGATNREDMIDPAVLRPGRLDVKIRIDRPDREGAREIFSLYVTEFLPLREDDVARAGSRAAAAEELVRAAVERMYAREPDTEFLTITHKDGSRETLYFADYASGAVIRNVVDRAKKQAIKTLLTTGRRGLTAEHLVRAVDEEFHEQQDLPNTGDAEDWARLTGRRADTFQDVRIVRHTPAQGEATEQDALASGSFTASPSASSGVSDAGATTGSGARSDAGSSTESDRLRGGAQ